MIKAPKKLLIFEFRMFINQYQIRISLQVISKTHYETIINNDLIDPINDNKIKLHY